MSKKGGLEAMIEQLPDMRSGKLNWCERLKLAHPEFYAEVESLIDRHITGDQGLRRKLPTEASLCRFLAPELAKRGEKITPGTISELVRERKGK